MVMVLMSLVGGVILTLAQTANRLWVPTDVQLATLTDAHRALDHLEKDLHAARASTLVCSAGAAENFTDDQLSFDRVGGASIGYRVQAGQLVRREGGGPDAPLATGVTAFVPNCLAGGLVRLQLTVQGNVERGGLPQTLHTDVWVRNP